MINTGYAAYGVQPVGRLDADVARISSIPQDARPEQQATAVGRGGFSYREGEPRLDAPAMARPEKEAPPVSLRPGDNVRALAARLDPRDMSPQAFEAAAGELFQAGLVGRDEYLSATVLARNPDLLVSQPRTPGGNTDWLAECRAGGLPGLAGALGALEAARTYRPISLRA